MSASIILYFFYKEKNIDRFQLSFQTSIQEISGNYAKVNVYETFFRNGHVKHPVTIRLFKTKSTINKEYDFHIYYGNNFAYVQLDGFYSQSYEILLKSIENLNIFSDEIKFKFTELDTMNTIDRKRLVLINYSSSFLTINGIHYDLGRIIQNNCNKNSSSYQLSEIDLPNKSFIVKPYEEIEETNIDSLITKKEEYQKFWEDLKDIILSI